MLQRRSSWYYLTALVWWRWQGSNLLWLKSEDLQSPAIPLRRHLLNCLVHGTGIEPVLFTWKANVLADRRTVHIMLLVLLTHYLLCSTELPAGRTVYIHSYVGLTFTQGLTSAKLITHYMKTHYGNYTSNIRPSLIFSVLSLLPNCPSRSELSFSYASYT